VADRKVAPSNVLVPTTVRNENVGFDLTAMVDVPNEIRLDPAVINPPMSAKAGAVPVLPALST
jgi:hypothetical protein